MSGKKELTLKGAANLPLHELEGLSEEEKEEYFGPKDHTNAESHRQIRKDSQSVSS